MTRFTALNAPQQPRPDSDSESDSAMSEVSQSRHPESDSESDSSMSAAASELPKKLETSAASGSTSGSTTFRPRDRYRRVKLLTPGLYSDTHTMNSDSEDNQKDIIFESDVSEFDPASQK